jgi:hypothetical protein
MNQKGADFLTTKDTNHTKDKKLTEGRKGRRGTKLLIFSWFLHSSDSKR